MRHEADPRTRVRMLCSWLLIFVLMLAVGHVVRADAASLSVSWSPPTLNDDGTPLTDLASYNIYFASNAPPACPGTPFRTVASPTTTPESGQTVTELVTGLTASTTYFVSVTAVDLAGNESACSASASAVAAPVYSVTPSTATSFGSVTTGTTVDRTFTVQNTSTTSISGSATVGTPFGVVSGGAFTLSAGASQSVIVRFQPTTVDTFVANVIFTAAGDTVSRSVSGSATASAPATVTLSVTTGGTGAGVVVSSPVGIACGTTCTQTVATGTQVKLTATPADGSTFTSWSGPCSGTATCAMTLSADTTVIATFDTVPADQAPVPAVSSLSPATAGAGDAGLILAVNGSGFVASSVARWDGAPRTTTVVNANQLSFAVTASDLATPRSVSVSVFTPSPGGGTSAEVSFTITAPSVANEIIIDNADPGVQDAAGGRTFTGRWCLSNAVNKFGPNSLYSCGFARDTYRWTPRIPASGDYDVYVWFATAANRSATVPIVVTHANGTTTSLFDERTGGGQWVLHGRYTFTAGTTGYIQTSDVNGLAGADAVRFVSTASALPTPGTPPPSSPPSAGLVAAYAFNESNGATVTDVSGNNNTGTLGSGVMRTTQGRFGGALVFDGTDTVTVPHSDSLNLISGMTLEAWVFPTATPTQWATVLMKEQTGTFAYTLYAGSPADQPNGYFNTGTSQDTEQGVAGPSSLPLNTWSHLATTYDGTILRLYVNGVEVANAAFTGSIVTSTGVLSFGGNNVWAEFFQGVIDEVRIYNRALEPAEIHADMNTPVGG